MTLEHKHTFPLLPAGNIYHQHSYHLGSTSRASGWDGQHVWAQVREYKNHIRFHLKKKKKERIFNQSIIKLSFHAYLVNDIPSKPHSVCPNLSTMPWYQPSHNLC